MISVFVDVLRAFGMVACALFAICTAYAAWNILRIPKGVQRRYRLLDEAVKAMNRGTASEEERERVADAQKLGMVNTGFWVKGGCLHMHYYITRTANEYWFKGYYPTTAELNEELEEFRIA